MNLPLLRPLFALALWAILFPSAHAETDTVCHYVKVASLPLRYTGPGLEVTTEGSINGTAATMLVDTGAFDTLLTHTGAERRNLFLRGTGGYATGIGGTATIYETHIEGLSVGPARSGRTWLRVLTDFGDTPSYDAIIGAPFLLQADMELSLATKELRFFRPHNCKDKFLAYWDEAAMEIPFESSRGTGPNPRFSVLVNGQKMTAMIDTGATISVIGLRAAKRAGLKLDAPDVKRRDNMSGIGTRRVAHWTARFDTFQLAEETVKHAEMGVLDWDDEVDVLLGTDFLRAHRLLFAMSQRKLYISYVGGDPFSPRNKLEPWVQQEAEAGNADAQLALARRYDHGNGVPQDRALGASWLEKAARGGNPQANIVTGRALMFKGFPEEGASRLRKALDKLPAQRDVALMLYLARVLSKEAELAKTELAANFAHDADRAWPAPIADFYLGKIGADALLKQAGAKEATASERTCLSLMAMAQWHYVHNERERSAALNEQYEASCGRPAPKG